MRDASTQLKTDLIFQQLASSNSKAEVVVEYDNSGTWVEVGDLDTDNGVSWSEAGKRNKYANWGLTP